MSFHRRESLREFIEAHSATVKFLPAYSREFNQIEECWSKFTAWIRKQAARTVRALQETLTEAIQQVTLKDPENNRIRYTIHPDAHKEILKRLLLLNHAIHADEVRQQASQQPANKAAKHKNWPPQAEKLTLC